MNSEVARDGRGQWSVRVRHPVRRADGLHPCGLRLHQFYVRLRIEPEAVSALLTSMSSPDSTVRGIAAKFFADTNGAEDVSRATRQDIRHIVFDYSIRGRETVGALAWFGGSSSMAFRGESPCADSLACPKRPPKLASV